MAFPNVFWRIVGFLMTIRSIGARIIKDNTAATAVEYGVILAVVVLVVIVALGGVAKETIGLWNTISTKSSAAISSS